MTSMTRSVPGLPKYTWETVAGWTAGQFIGIRAWKRVEACILTRQANFVE